MGLVKSFMVASATGKGLSLPAAARTAANALTDVLESARDKLSEALALSRAHEKAALKDLYDSMTIPLYVSGWQAT